MSDDTSYQESSEKPISYTLNPPNGKFLNGVLKLADLEDVEEFAHIHARAYLRKRNIYIPFHEYEELVAYIITLVWELYANKWNREHSFAGYAGYIVQRRITDHFRDKWGRKGEKIAINQAAPFSELGEIESTITGYDKADSVTSLVRLLV